MNVALVRRTPHVGRWEYQVALRNGTRHDLTICAVGGHFFEFRLEGGLYRSQTFASREGAWEAAMRYFETQEQQREMAVR